MFKRHHEFKNCVIVLGHNYILTSCRAEGIDTHTTDCISLYKLVISPEQCWIPSTHIKKTGKLGM